MITITLAPDLVEPENNKKHDNDYINNNDNHYNEKVPYNNHNKHNNYRTYNDSQKCHIRDKINHHNQSHISKK